MSKDILYPYTYSSWLKSNLAKRCVCTHERSWDIPNMNSEPGKSKWLAKGNSEEMPHKSNSNYRRLQLSNSDTVSEFAHLSIHTCCTLFFLWINIFICFPIFYLCGNSFLQTQRARPLSLTRGLVVRIWCSHCCNTASVSGWEPKLQAIAGWGHPRSASLCIGLTNLHSVTKFKFAISPCVVFFK